MPVAALFAAWLLPGLGHIVLGERVRGLIIMVALGSLYTAGLLIGSIDVIDRREDTLWFVGQVIAGPTTIVLDEYAGDLRSRAQARVEGRTFPASTSPQFDNLPLVRSVGRVNELGTLYCALAGMLNLLVIVDILFRIDPSPARSSNGHGKGGGYVAGRGADA